MGILSQRLSCSGEGGRSSGLERSGLALLRFLRRKPAPPPGTLRWAQFLPDEKLGKESLRAFPPKDLPGVRGCPCVKSRFGPSPLLWPLFVPPHQATLGSWPYGWVVSTSGPTLPQRRSRRRSSPPHHRSCIFHYSLFIIHSSFIIILRAYSIPPRSETDSKPNSPHTPAPGTNPPPGYPPLAG